MKVVIVYPFLAHYREAILNTLTTQRDPLPRYSIMAGPDSSKFSIKTIDAKRSSLPTGRGGLRWVVVRNFWFGPFLWQTKIIRLAFTKEIDAIIFLGNPYFLSTWATCAICRLTRKRTLMWTHGFLKYEKGILGLIRRQFYRLADALLLYGNRSAQICKKMGFKADRLYVIFNSLDYKSQVAIREHITESDRIGLKKEHFANYNLPLLISVCRLTPRKRLDMLIEAVKGIRSRGLKVNVMFVGDGPSRSYLENLTSQWQLNENIKFLGACYDERRLGLIFSTADLCVMPGEIGLTCIHALTYGTPVITHNKPELQMPEFEAIIPGFNGDLFEHNSQSDLEEKIVKWLLSSRLREEIRANCQKVVDELFNPEFQRKMINSAVLGVPASLCPCGKTAYDPLFS